MSVRKILRIARTFLRDDQIRSIGLCSSNGRGKQGIETQRQLPLIHKRQAVQPGFFEDSRANTRPGQTSRQPIERMELKTVFSIGIKSAK
ncbi:hypothetical protein ASD91_17365 [Pseudomonas sp. Root68]|nr:hypothetical protein ASD91_17365 [Pseudomonas sp. Root68]KRB63598.1 hypothetical protein ASD95_17925 [Pseudomonas sp. Root71]